MQNLARYLRLNQYPKCNRDNVSRQISCISITGGLRVHSLNLSNYFLALAGFAFMDF